MGKKTSKRAREILKYKGRHVGCFGLGFYTKAVTILADYGLDLANIITFIHMRHYQFAVALGSTISVSTVGQLRSGGPLALLRAARFSQKHGLYSDTFLRYQIIEQAEAIPSLFISVYGFLFVVKRPVALMFFFLSIITSFNAIVD